jgi:hypothetical protein
MARFAASLGDELEVRPSENEGWISCVVTYADSRHGTGFIVDSQDGRRWSFADSTHEDIRKPQGKTRSR